MTAEHNFSFDIKIGSHAVGLIEDATAILEHDPSTGDWCIRDVQLNGVVLPEGHYLYQPIMLWLLGEERAKLEQTWRWRKWEQAA